MTNEEKKEFTALLFTESSNSEVEGLLNFCKRSLTGDKPQREIARVIELLGKI